MTQPTLLLIDIQQGLDEPNWGQRNNPSAEANMLRLLKAWRENEFPIVHIQHSSTNPDSALNPSKAGFAFKPEVIPLKNETVFVKHVNSAFIGTNLETYLRDNKMDSLVIIGLTTDHCVSTTTRMAGNLGFTVQLVSDATATFERTDKNGRSYSAEDMHDVNLASLDGEFCEVVTTDEVLVGINKHKQ